MNDDDSTNVDALRTNSPIAAIVASDRVRRPTLLKSKAALTPIWGSRVPDDKKGPQ